MEERIAHVANLVLEHREASTVFISDALAGRVLKADHPLYRLLLESIEKFRLSGRAAAIWTSKSCPDQVKFNQAQAIETRASMLFPNAGAPYVTRIEPLLSSFGAPCTAPPWAVLSAVDLVSGTLRWQVPLGSIEKLAPLPIPWELGTPGAGGPLVTAGGLVFIGYTLDDKFRAFDLLTGKTLWKASLPAAGTATPMTYEANGEQYVVIPAGGHSMYGSTRGDSVVAYKLKHVSSPSDR